MDRKPSGWSFRRRQLSYNDPFTNEMLSAGRRPDPVGNWKTTPGARTAQQDIREPMPGDNMGGGLTPEATWASFFGSNTTASPQKMPLGVTGNAAKNDVNYAGGPVLAPQNPVAAPDMAADWAASTQFPSPAQPSSYISSVAQSTKKYFDDAGSPMPSASPGTFDAQTYNQPFGPLGQELGPPDPLDAVDDFFGVGEDF